MPSVISLVTRIPTHGVLNYLDRTTMILGRNSRFAMPRSCDYAHRVSEKPVRPLLLADIQCPNSSEERYQVAKASDYASGEEGHWEGLLGVFNLSGELIFECNNAI
ncbi:hypothetical protein MRB53_002287 [Persea americana]|uniref:Uncharacterized protein n=1 Tax=Persea americana TaxID=3435 RepID=A0ACC2MUA8_PERAE|nr:hypothetical protein MRB53_002287 [Persea americana]